MAPGAVVEEPATIRVADQQENILFEVAPEDELRGVAAPVQQEVGPEVDEPVAAVRRQALAFEAAIPEVEVAAGPARHREVAQAILETEGDLAQGGRRVPVGGTGQGRGG